MKQWIASSLLLAVFSGPSSAAAEIVTDRPDVAESSRTVGKMRLQVEAGVDTTALSAFTFPTKIRFGLIDPLEVHVESGIVTVGEGGTSVNDVDLGGKVHLFEVGRLSGGLLTAVTIPIENVAVLVRPTFALDLDLGRLGIGINVGADIPLTERATVSDELRFATALGVGLFGGLGAFVEVFGAIPVGGELVLSFDGGFSYAINATNQVDAYVRFENVTDSAVPGGGIGYATKF